MINDAETVSDGIGLESVNQVFLQQRHKRKRHKREVEERFHVIKRTEDPSPFGNVAPKPFEEQATKYDVDVLSRNDHLGHQENIEESSILKKVLVLLKLTRLIATHIALIYDASKQYPVLRLRLPTMCFLKCTNYPDLISESFPEKDSYYDMCLKNLKLTYYSKTRNLQQTCPGFLCQDIGMERQAAQYI